MWPRISFSWLLGIYTNIFVGCNLKSCMIFFISSWFWLLTKLFSRELCVSSCTRRSGMRTSIRSLSLMSWGLWSEFKYKLSSKIRPHTNFVKKSDHDFVGYMKIYKFLTLYQFRIEDIIDQEVQNLSGGELQRVAMALCLGKQL